MLRKNSKHFTGRLNRSLTQPLSLIHHSNSDFFILGSTGNVYTVTLSATPSCNCPDPITPCKHILFLFITVLNTSTNDPCLRRQTLQPCELTRLRSTKVNDEVLVDEYVRDRFLEKFNERKLSVSVEDGCKCMLCLEVMGVDGLRVVKCATCKNPVHEKCLWRVVGKRDDEYINLSAYVSYDDDDDVVEMEPDYKRLKREEKKDGYDIRCLVEETRVKRDQMAMVMMEREENMRDLKFYNETCDHLKEPNKTVTMDMKREIAERWGWPRLD